MSQLPVPVPAVSPATKRFWAATAESRFVLQRCAPCDLVLWFPRTNCPECWTTDLSEFDASGLGTIYSYTVIRKGAGVYKESAPFVVAYVELDEGPRVLTNIVDCDAGALSVGMRVRMVFHDTGQGSALYRFTPID